MQLPIRTYVWGLLLGLGAAGCDQMSAAVLPRCGDGMVLGTDGSGHLTCQVAPPGVLEVRLPEAGCAAGQALGSFGPPTQISCVEIPTGPAGRPSASALRQHLAATAQTLQGIAQGIAQLNALKYSGTALYIGTTRAVTTGRITRDGQVGLAAATALCVAEFGAHTHMCTAAQLVHSVTAAKLTPKDRIAPAWIYMPSWHNPHNSTVEPTAGLADNCGGYTTQDDTTGYTGVAVEWAPLGSGDVAFRWHGGDEAPCSASLPVACCQASLP